MSWRSKCWGARMRLTQLFPVLKCQLSKHPFSFIPMLPLLSAYCGGSGKCKTGCNWSESICVGVKGSSVLFPQTFWESLGVCFSEEDGRRLESTGGAQFVNSHLPWSLRLSSSSKPTTKIPTLPFSLQTFLAASSED